MVRDEAEIIEKFRVKPESIPDYLAVVGDSTDWYPRVPGWGVKAAASVLSRHSHLESVPKDWQQWHPTIRKARPLSESLFSAGDDALLFRELATLRRDLPVFGTVEYLRWHGPVPSFEEHCKSMNPPDLLAIVAKAAATVSAGQVS